MKRDDGKGLGRWRTWDLGKNGGVDGDLPGLGVLGNPQGDRGAGSPVDQRLSDTGFPEQISRPVQGVSLADGAEVNAGRGVRELNRVGFRMENQLGGSDGGAGFFESGRIGQMSCATDKSPGLKKGTDRDVEGASRGLTEEDSLLEKVEHLGGDANRVVGGVAVDGGDFAPGLVDAQGGVESLNLGDGFLAGGAEGRGAWALEDEFKPGRHGQRGELKGGHREGVWRRGGVKKRGFAG